MPFAHQPPILQPRPPPICPRPFRQCRRSYITSATYRISAGPQRPHQKTLRMVRFLTLSPQSSWYHRRNCLRAAHPAALFVSALPSIRQPPLPSQIPRGPPLGTAKAPPASLRANSPTGATDRAIAQEGKQTEPLAEACGPKPHTPGPIAQNTSAHTRNDPLQGVARASGRPRRPSGPTFLSMSVDRNHSGKEGNSKERPTSRSALPARGPRHGGTNTCKRPNSRHRRDCLCHEDLCHELVFVSPCRGHRFVRLGDHRDRLHGFEQPERENVGLRRERDVLLAVDAKGDRRGKQRLPDVVMP